MCHQELGPIQDPLQPIERGSLFSSASLEQQQQKKKDGKDAPAIRTQSLKI